MELPCSTEISCWWTQSRSIAAGKVLTILWSEGLLAIVLEEVSHVVHRGTLHLRWYARLRDTGEGCLLWSESLSSVCTEGKHSDNGGGIGAAERRFLYLVLRTLQNKHYKCV